MKIPFTLESWLKDKSQRVETRDGNKVRVLCYDANNTMPVVALVTFNNGIEGPLGYYSNGTMISDRESPLDLFIVTPEEELTEFEDGLRQICEDAVKEAVVSPYRTSEDFAKRHSAELLSLAIDARAKELSNSLKQSKLDKDGIPYHLIEFMCNLYTCQNWKEIEDTAELYVSRIKAAALKDLPRWKKDKSFETEGTFMGVKGRECFIVKDGYSISVAELIEKLPGFKED